MLILKVFRKDFISCCSCYLNSNMLILKENLENLDDAFEIEFKFQYANT